MVRALMMTGGAPSHDFKSTAPVLAKVLNDAGIVTETEWDFDAAARKLDAGGYDLLVVHALRWRMHGEKYEADRPAYQYTPPEAVKSAIANHVARGGGLFALHTAMICFDDWPEWLNILGGGWVWGQSFHPPYGTVQAAITDVAHPITAGLPKTFTINDEVYSKLAFTPDATPLMMLQAPDGSAPQSGAWARQVGKGRVAFECLGHDIESIEHPVHKRLLLRCALWAAGRPDSELQEV